MMQNWTQPSFSRVRISYERVLQKHPAVRAQCRWLDAAGQQPPLLPAVDEDLPLGNAELLHGVVR